MNFDAFAPFYDDDYRGYCEDIPLVLETAGKAGDRALELGCGTGRVLLPLAEAGCSAIGVDASAALLAVARGKAARQGLTGRVRLEQADMMTFHLGQTQVDFACIVSNTLMHLTSWSEQLMALQCANRHLRSGGLLLIDLFNPDLPYLESISGIQELADRWEGRSTGAEVLKWTTRRLDASRQLQETEFVYEEVFPDGRSRETRLAFFLRYVMPEEGARLLARAGFTVEALLGDFDGGRYCDSSERLIFIARKGNV